MSANRRNPARRKLPKAPNTSPSYNHTGSLEQVSRREGVRLLAQANREFTVFDLGLMIDAQKLYVPEISGPMLAEYARNIANGVEHLDDATDVARNFATFLAAITTKTSPTEKGWNGLAVLSFWTARNAIHAWQCSIDGIPLREHMLQWWQESPPPQRLADTSLALRTHPQVYIHSGDIFIQGPKWFLDARDLPFPQANTDDRQWLALSRAVMNDYLREALKSECLPEAQRTVDTHDAVATALERMGILRGPDGRLRLDSYGGDRCSGDHTSNTPGRIVDRLMDNVKGKLSTLPDWAFHIRKSTLLGLMPLDPEKHRFG